MMEYWWNGLTNFNWKQASQVLKQGSLMCAYSYE